MELIYKILEILLPFSWMQYGFMKNAFLAILLISPLFGLIGTMIVTNKMSFFSDSLGHSALTGIALGAILGINNFTISTLIFAIIFALLVMTIVESGVSSADTILGVFSSTAVALGILILSIKGGFNKYSSYLIGDVLSITRKEILTLFIISIIVFFIWILSFNKLTVASLNSGLARSRGINVNFYKNVFAVLIALVVTISLKWVGILIINSLLVLPAASAKNLAKNMKSYCVLSILFSLFAGISGLIVSFYGGVNTGAAIVLISAAMFFVSFFMNKKFKI